MKTKTFGQSPLLEAKTIISYSIMETSTQGRKEEENERIALSMSKKGKTKGRG